MDGMSELLRRLKELEPDFKEVEREIVWKATDVMKQEVIKNAPVEHTKKLSKLAEKYGHLKDNITQEWDASNETLWIHGGKSFWGNFLEYGTKSMKKQPFLEKSYLNKKDEVMKNINEEIKKRLGLS